MPKDPILLIDGDQFLYRAAAACETDVRFGNDTHVLYSDAHEAHMKVLEALEEVFEALGTRKARLAFTDHSRYFRKELYPGYKGNRITSRKPLAYFEVRERLGQDFPTLTVPGLEADDVLGIWQTRNPEENTIIVSEDKDLQTIPGKLWRAGELREISEADADYYHLFQTLTGDQTDGYPGCPGIGPVKAEKILASAQDEDHPEFAGAAWLATKKAFEAAGLTEADALLQARMARILRSSDWDSEKREVKLWAPMSSK